MNGRDVHSCFLVLMGLASREAREDVGGRVRVLSLDVDVDVDDGVACSRVRGWMVGC